MGLHVTSVPPPGADAQPPPDLSDAADVERREHLHLYGHADLLTGADQLAVSLRHQETTRKHLLLARVDGRAVGSARLFLPLTDNTSHGMVILALDPAADLAEVAGSLWDEARALFVAQGRTSVQAWQGHRAPSGSAPGSTGTTWLHPASGAGRLPEDDLARWLAGSGFTLEQVELHSELDLRATAQRLGPLTAQARAVAHPAYDLQSWVGPTPQRWWAGMAALRARMSTDAPSADLDQEEDAWDL